MKQRLPPLPDVVNHLTYSSDGKRLAASLGGHNGIRVFDATNDYRLLPSDTQYGQRSTGAHFDRTGRLVTVSYDGFVRLYEADRYATPTYQWKGKRPYSAVFSPDASRIAVGDNDSSEVVVLSGRDLRQLFKPNTTGISKE